MTDLKALKTHLAAEPHHFLPRADCLALIARVEAAEALLERDRENASVTIERLRDDVDAAKARGDEARGMWRSQREQCATHRCKVCKALWIHYAPGEVTPTASWSLASATCGKCCDNVAMGEQIEAIGLTARLAALRPLVEAVREWRMTRKAMSEVDAFRNPEVVQRYDNAVAKLSALALPEETK